MLMWIEFKHTDPVYVDNMAELSEILFVISRILNVENEDISPKQDHFTTCYI
jgi:hypothetical protein